MKYKVTVWGYGDDVHAGEVPDEIAKYIDVECGGDADEYRDRHEDGELPAGVRIADDFWDLFDESGFCEICGAGPTAVVTVEDESGDEVFDLTVGEMYDPENGQTHVQPSTSKYGWLAYSSEKGTWFSGEFETDGKFDPGLLKAFTKTLEYGEGEEYTVLTRLEYDGVEIDGEFSSTDGKSAGMSVFPNSEFRESPSPGENTEAEQA